MSFASHSQIPSKSLHKILTTKQFSATKMFYGEILSTKWHLMPVPPVKHNRLVQDGVVGDRGPVFRETRNGFHFAFAVRQEAFQIVLIL